MRIVRRCTRRDGTQYYEVACWWDPRRSFVNFNGIEYESHIDAVLAERANYMRQTIKTESIGSHKR
jgi:hypothetical protein